MNLIFLRTVFEIQEDLYGRSSAETVSDDKFGQKNLFANLR